MAKVGVIGAGSWGIALSFLLHNNGHEVTVWSALPEEIRRLAAENRIRKEKTGGIQKRKTGEKGNARKKRFHRGDSVMILPDQKTGIVWRGGK